MKTYYVRGMSSPFGGYSIALDETGAVIEIAFARGAVANPAVDLAIVSEGAKMLEDKVRTATIAAQLDEFFDGGRRTFDYELSPRGTDFQQRVWQHLLEIPLGETHTYGEVAIAVGRPGAARAVGRACATNPIAIVIPCHRVVGRDGSLTGFGGGLPFKQGLLELEGRKAGTLLKF